MLICADALIIYAKRHAEKAKELLSKEKDPKEKRTGENCRCMRTRAGSPTA
jgi:formate C-acetyltransferase